MTEAGVDVTAMAGDAERLRSEGASVMYLAADGRLAGFLAVADPIKDSTPEAIAALKAVALGIDEVHGEVRPQDKADLVARLEAEGRHVAMAGDGINDAPALAMSLSSVSVVANALRLRRG